jgi:hypothetical protein
MKRPIAPPAPRQQPVEVEVFERPKQEIQLMELKPLEHATNQLNPIADLEARAREMLASGNDEALVAVQCGVTLSKVFEIRRGVIPQQVANRAAPTNNAQSQTEKPSARELFARRMHDFDECLEIATQEYKNDPQSEANYNAMNGFMKTLKELFSAYEELEDPQELSERLVKQVIFPFMRGIIQINVESFRSIMADIGPTLVSEFQREQLNEGLKETMKKIEESTRNEFNRSVKTLEEIFEVKMDTLYLRPRAPGMSDKAEVKNAA